MKKTLLLIVALVLFATGTFAATINVPADYTSIQAAIDAAFSGDDIVIAAGSFVAPAQIVINKDLTLTGAGAALTTIEPGFNTSVGYYLVSDALIYVDYGVTAVIQDLAIDGTGFTVRHAIQSRGADLIVRNCVIRDIYAAIYAGRGIVFLTGTGLVENCVMTGIQRIGVHIRGDIEAVNPVVTVDGLHYTGKGTGDFLDYGIEFGGGGSGTAINCTITACSGVAVSDGSTSGAILATDFYGSGTSADVSDCSLTGNTAGFIVGYILGDLTSGTIHNCDLSGNSTAGVVSLVPGADATGNYWGSNDPLVVAAAAGANVDFSPWYGDSIGSVPMTIGTSDSIQEAIALANSGDTINVAPGTYVESGQIVIDKDLSIIGDLGSRPIIMTDQNTASSGDARGWFLQMPGTHFVMKNVELDGAGFDIYQGIRSQEGAELDNCAFRNITFPGYGGMAIAAFTTYGNWTVNNCTFDNIGRIGILFYGTGLTDSYFTGNTYTGKGVGDWIDYGVEVGAGAVVTIEDNTMTACQGVASDGSTSGALLVTTYFGLGSTAMVNNNILTGNTEGVLIGYDASDASIVSGHGNDLSGNDSYGVSNTGANTVDFHNNWWGSASGPFHGTLNPSGTGVAVGDNVLFDPWSGPASFAVTPATSGPLMCSGQPDTLVFSLTLDDYTADVFGFSAVVRTTSEMAFDTVTSLDAFGATTQFFSFDQGDGSFLISGTTQGSPTQPISGAGSTDLFSIIFTTVSEGTAQITFDSFTVRDPANQPIPATAEGASILVDCSAPVAVTDIDAQPHHNKVTVTWTHDGLDTDHYEIYRGLWYDVNIGDSAYPEYDDLTGDVIPTRGADRTAVQGNAEWMLAGIVPAGTFTFDDAWGNADDRGVYYYEVFAVDAAAPVGNNTLAAAANDRATNYWLGDMNENGEVAVYDMSVLGSAFGTSELVGGDYNAYADVGPTDDWSRVGVPNTDDYVNFEDLMVFSMNFGVVSSSNKSDIEISTKADLSWVRYDEGTYALRLNDASGLKGVHLRADLPEGASVTVTEGDLLDQQTEMTFLRNIGEDLDVSLAITGVDNGFMGQGDLFIVECTEELAMEDIVIDLRGSDNSRIEVSLDSEVGTLTPRVFGLNAAYPNPFNPMTKISFSLPESQDVRLNVYGIDGKLVTTLVNETRGAGLHEVIWNGQNDAGQVQASGLYFYRIEAGPYSQVRKMTLMK